MSTFRANTPNIDRCRSARKSVTASRLTRRMGWMSPVSAEERVPQFAVLLVEGGSSDWRKKVNAPSLAAEIKVHDGGFGIVATGKDVLGAEVAVADAPVEAGSGQMRQAPSQPCAQTFQVVQIRRPVRQERAPRMAWAGVPQPDSPRLRRRRQCELPKSSDALCKNEPADGRRVCSAPHRSTPTGLPRQRERGQWARLPSGAGSAEAKLPSCAASGDGTPTPRGAQNASGVRAVNAISEGTRRAPYTRATRRLSRQAYQIGVDPAPAR